MAISTARTCGSRRRHPVLSSSRSTGRMPDWPWPPCDHADIERLANCGAVFRALAVITWDANHLAEAWADAFLPNLHIYQAELVRALDHLGWPFRSESAGRAPAQQGQPR